MGGPSEESTRGVSDRQSLRESGVFREKDDGDEAGNGANAKPISSLIAARSKASLESYFFCFNACFPALRRITR